MGSVYPRLEIRLDAILHNAAELKRRCEAQGIEMAAVLKGAQCALPIVRAVYDAGIRQLATSRLSQIRRCLEAGIEAEWLLLRIPQRCECEQVVKLCDISLASERETVLALETACRKLNTVHRIILMKDLGDLREGYWHTEELLADCAVFREQCPHITVAGIGANFMDFGGVVPTAGAMEELISIGRAMEQVLGYPLQYISGGATNSFPLIQRGEMPHGINHIRLGETLLLAHDLPEEWHLEGADFLRPTMRLQAQVVELRQKPSLPQGETFLNGFGDLPRFTDRGIRKRALAALGRLDVGSEQKLIPLDPGVEILGASSDHMILDVENCPHPLRVGDVLSFALRYENMLFATAAADVAQCYLTGEQE